MGWATLSGPVAVAEKRLKAAARNSAREKGEEKAEELGKVVFGSAI